MLNSFSIGLRLLLTTVIITSCLVIPRQAKATADPGQDPFGLTPEKLRLFQGYEGAGDSVNSLFGGDEQKHNGLFTTPPTQLGGATPYLELIQPERQNDGGPTHIMLTSAYTPTGDLTSASIITLTVTVTNVGDHTAKDVQLHVTLEDKNAALAGSPVAAPPLAASSSIDTELTWPAFTLEAGASTTFSWSFKPHKNDSILRWRIVAEFGAGESILLQWIPIKNPNPQAGVPGGGSPGGGSYLNPCANSGGSGPFPEGKNPDDIISLFKQNWNISLVSTDYSFASAEYLPMLKAWWEALALVECTPFLQEGYASSHTLEVRSDALGGWWGTYLGGYVQQMDIRAVSQGTVAHMKQNLIHELGHVYEGTDPNGVRAKWEAICHNGSPYAEVSGYGTNNCNENFAEVVGYYAVRESNEWGADPPARCPSKNPFDWGQSTFYEFAKTNVYGGKEFGPAAPNPPTSC